LRNLDEDFHVEDEAFVSPSEAGWELTERVLTTLPTNGQVPPYSQIPITFVCWTKKTEKVNGFSDHANWKFVPPHVDPATLGKGK